MINVGYDLDGVIMDSAILFRAMIYNKFKTYKYNSYDKAGNEKFKWEIEGVSSTKVWNVIHTVLREYQPFCPPFPGAVACVAESFFLNGEKPVHIVTARPKDVEDQTREWLDEHLKDIEYELWIVDPPKNDKTLNQEVKNELVNDLGLTHFVEDRLKYASQIVKGCPSIEKVYLLNRSYNKGRRSPKNVQRIDDITEVVVDIYENR
jgi:hypothetical protein